MKRERGAEEDFLAATHPNALGMQWQQVDPTFLFCTYQGARGKPKLAMFDLDHTLVVPQSNRRFARSRTDWQYWSDEVKPKLERLHREGWHVVLFTNQSNLVKDPVKQQMRMGMIMDLAEDLAFPLSCCIACAKDKWRKPLTSMFDHLTGGIKPADGSFYCGDAAGRVAAWDGDVQTKKDFACSDRKFAHNMCVPFYTPEEFFLNEPPTRKWDWGSRDPLIMARMYSTTPPPVLETKPGQEMVLLVGSPASGKSTIATGPFASYTRVNRDTLGTRSACHRLTLESLKAGESVVIDNTNRDLETRAEYITLAKQVGVPVRCLVIDTPRELAAHLNSIREARVPYQAFSQFDQNFVEPTMKEGFVSVQRVSIQLDLSDEEFASRFYKWSK